MDEYTFTTVLVFTFLMIVFLLLVLAETVSLYSNRLARLQEENKYLRQLIQESFLLDNDGMMAFNKMFNAACLHGFGENVVDADI